MKTRETILPSSLSILALLSISDRACASDIAPEDPQDVAATSSESSSEAATNARVYKNSQPIEVRVSFSDSASALLAQPLLERYLSIELDEDGNVATHANGPLSDDVAYVWIDVSEHGKVVIQTRVGRGEVATRSYPLREELRSDVAARLVAIAASDMIRSQRKPKRTGKPKVRRRPSPEQIEEATRDNPALLLDGAVEAAWLPSIKALLIGPSVELAFRFRGIRPFMRGSSLFGLSEAGSARWLSVGLGADRALFWQHAGFRVGVGVAAQAATVRLSSASFNADASHDTWNADVALRIHNEVAVTRSLWLGLSLEPGILLRSALFDSDNHSMSGFFLGGSIGIQFESRYTPTTFAEVGMN